MCPDIFKYFSVKKMIRQFLRPQSTGLMRRCFATVFAKKPDGAITDKYELTIDETASERIRKL